MHDMFGGRAGGRGGLHEGRFLIYKGPLLLREYGGCIGGVVGVGELRW